MNCQFNWEQIANQPSPDDRVREVDRQTNVLLEKYGTIPLTDCIMHRSRGGHLVIVDMDRRHQSTDYGQQDRGTYKLRLLRHESIDAEPPKAGDTFMWVVGEKSAFLDGEGRKRPMNNMEKQRMMRYNKTPGDRWDWRIWRKHILDADCCFVVGYYDAMALLVNKSDLSDYEEKGPHSWYWLVSEVIPTAPLATYAPEVDETPQATAVAPAKAKAATA